MQNDPESGRPIVEISHSGLATADRCPRKFAYRKILVNADTTRFSSTAADVGTAIHEGLQHYAVHRDQDAAILKMAEHHPVTLHDTAKATQYSLEAATTTLLDAMEHEIFSYDLVYVDTPDGRHLPGIEAKFLVEVDLGPECPLLFHLRGYMDLILRNPVSGNILPVDIKTTTPQSAATLEAKYAYDYQTTSYGVPLNALIGELDRFDTGIFGVILSDTKPKSSFYHYTRTNGDIEDYQIYLQDACSRIARYYKNEHFPRGPNACVSFGTLCHYHPHCHLRSLSEMQNRINPSGKTHTEIIGRPDEDAWIKVKIEGQMI